jgi:hypothetical protein
VRSGHVRVDGLTVAAAEVRGRVERPPGFGVDALQGGFTLWNQQPDPAVEITAELLDLAAGDTEHPVRGSGVFVGGHGDWNGPPTAARRGWRCFAPERSTPAASRRARRT